MAEMTAAQAIKVLHNNQYQKHIGNGEYDYIHPLTDAEAKLIEKLIEQQAQEIAKKDRILTLACDMLKSAHEACNDCPIENFCDCVEDREKVCPDVWREWLEKEAEEVDNG